MCTEINVIRNQNKRKFSDNETTFVILRINKKYSLIKKYVVFDVYYQVVNQETFMVEAMKTKQTQNRCSTASRRGFIIDEAERKQLIV